MYYGEVMLWEMRCSEEGKGMVRRGRGSSWKGKGKKEKDKEEVKDKGEARERGRLTWLGSENNKTVSHALSSQWYCTHFCILIPQSSLTTLKKLTPFFYPKKPYPDRARYLKLSPLFYSSTHFKEYKESAFSYPLFFPLSIYTKMLLLPKEESWCHFPCTPVSKRSGD